MKHVYLREIDPTADDSLARIVQFIPPASRVLDVGTGSGGLGRYLRDYACSVDGITYSEEEAALAKNDYARLEILDLENTLPSRLFKGQVYDVIVCADILEHLRNPLDVLRDLRSLLENTGIVLLSIPNATYMGVIFELMGGRFTRTREGILDATHVNFYDRSGLLELVNAAGFSIQAVSDVHKGLASSEFSELDTQAFPKCITDYVASRKDADVYQFVWTLAPVQEAGSSPQPELPIRPPVPIPQQFAAQVFWDFGHGFDETDSVHAWGVLDESPQTLIFTLSLPKKPNALRVDFADRAGIFEFFYFRLIDANNNVLFTWRGDWFSNLRMNDCEILPSTGPHHGRLFRASGNDPWISLPAEAHWQSAVRAELVMTAPQRYQDAAFIWADNAYRGTIQTLREQLASTTQSLRQALTKQAKTEIERDQLSQALADIKASTSWRITAGIRWFSSLLRSLR